MQKRALIVVTSHGRLGSTGRPTGWHLAEVTHVYWPLVEAGFAVDFASPKGGEAPMDPSSKKLDDPDNRRFLEDAALVERIKHTLPLADVDPARYDVVHFAGGHGTMWDFPGDRGVQRVVAGVWERGGVVAAVCHGPAALVDVKLSDGRWLVEGQDVSAYTDAEEQAAGLSQVVPFLLQSKLEARGARFHAGAKGKAQTSVSGRLITGQNPRSARALGALIVKVAGAAPPG